MTKNDIFPGISLVWESYKLDPYVQKFAEQVFSFEEKVEELLEMDAQITTEVQNLDTCQYNFQVFSEIIGTKIISKNLRILSYVQLASWVTLQFPYPTIALLFFRCSVSCCISQLCFVL